MSIYGKQPTTPELADVCANPMLQPIARYCAQREPGGAHSVMWDFTEPAGPAHQRCGTPGPCPAPCPYPDEIDVDDRPYLWDVRPQ